MSTPIYENSVSPFSLPALRQPIRSERKKSTPIDDPSPPLSVVVGDQSARAITCINNRPHGIRVHGIPWRPYNVREQGIFLIRVLLVCRYHDTVENWKCGNEVCKLPRGGNSPFPLAKYGINTRPHSRKRSRDTPKPLLPRITTS